MPFIRSDYQLLDWQTPSPITLLPDVVVTELFDPYQFLEKEYGDRVGVKAIHYNPKNKHHPYFVACRKPWKMHTDPGYARYAHHVVLIAENAGLMGLDGVILPISKGNSLIIDSHSPHALIPQDKEGGTVLWLSFAQDLPSPTPNFLSKHDRTDLPRFWDFFSIGS